MQGNFGKLPEKEGKTGDLCSRLRIPGIVFIYIFAVMVFTYPTVVHIGTSVNNPGDPFFYAWLMSWETHALTHYPSRFFHGNIFYPAEYTVAYSDNMFGSTLLFAIPYMLTRNPVLAYNVVFLMTFLFSALGMYFCVKLYTGNTFAAFLAGLFYGFAPYRFAHIGHLTLLSIQWIPFCLYFAEKYCLAFRKRYMVYYSAVFLIQILCSWYVAIFVVMVMVFFWIWKLITHANHMRLLLKHLLVSKIVIFLTVLPLMLPYIHVSETLEMKRTLEETALYSTDVCDYVRVLPENRIYGGLSGFLPDTANRSEHTLFPGFTIILLACIAVFAGGKRLTGLRIFYLVLGISAFILSLGPWLTVCGNQTGIQLPYFYLYRIVPVLKAIRAPARFMSVILVSLSVLAAVGTMSLFERVHSVKGRRMLLIIILGMLIMDSFHAPLWETRIELDPNGSYRYLARENLEPGPLLELPAGYTGAGPHNFIINTRYMLSSTIHWWPLFNGYASFHPGNFIDMTYIMHEFDGYKVWQFLGWNKVKYILVHTDYYEKGVADIILSRLDTMKGVSFVKQFRNDYLYHFH